jgi:HEAT repeat protein
VGKKATLPALLNVVQEKDFSKRDSAEIKAFFDAIGIVGSNEAIKPLQKLLEQKSWFGTGKKDEFRLRAAGALALIGSAEAKSILESGSNSKDENIRRACLQALRRQTP